MDPRLAQLAHNPNASKGQKALMELMLQRSAPKERKITPDAMGRKRYQDTGDFVFDDMQKYDKNVLSDAALAQKQAIAQAGKSNTNISFSPSIYDKGFSEAAGKNDSKSITEAYDKAARSDPVEMKMDAIPKCFKNILFSYLTELAYFLFSHPPFLKKGRFR